MKSARMEDRSPTAAAAALYESHHQSTTTILRPSSPWRGMTERSVPSTASRWASILYDSIRAAGNLLPKRVESYALDTID